MASFASSDSSAADPVSAPEQAAQVEGAGLSIPLILARKKWDLPGWDNDRPVPVYSAETLGELDLSLALLARYRNYLRPFHRLPSDILLAIFLEIQSSYSDPYGLFFGSYAYMSFAHVCHTWRQLVLATPIIWKQVSTRYPQAATAALERSSEAGFYLVIPEGTNAETSKRVLQEVAKHAHRLRRLYLPSDILKRNDGSMDPILEPLADTPAPLLEAIETVKMRGEGGCVPMPRLFGGQTPRLSRLHIQYMRPLADSVSLSNLRNLSFCGKKRTQIAMRVTDLFDLLEACPLLEMLQIKKINWEPMEEESTRRVRAEHLRLLDLGRTNASVIAEIIRKLDTPECALRLKVWLDRYEDSKFHIGVPTEHLLPVDHYLNKILKMHVHFLNGYDGVVIYGATDSLPFEIHGLLEGGTLQNLGDMDAIASTVFRSIINTFNFESLEDFAITEMHSHTRWTGFTRKVWRDMFCKMPELKSFHITMDSSHDEGFSRAILSALSTHDETMKMLLCPQLQSLDVFGDKTWSSLQCYTMAEERHKAGHPLQRVSMRLPHYASFENPDDTDLPLLRRYVKTVNLEPVDISFPSWPDTPFVPS